MTSVDLNNESQHFLDNRIPLHALMPNVSQIPRVPVVRINRVEDLRVGAVIPNPRSALFTPATCTFHLML